MRVAKLGNKKLQKEKKLFKMLLIVLKNYKKKKQFEMLIIVFKNNKYRKKKKLILIFELWQNRYHNSRPGH